MSARLRSPPRSGSVLRLIAFLQLVKPALRVADAQVRGDR